MGKGAEKEGQSMSVMTFGLERTVSSFRESLSEAALLSELEVLSPMM